MDIGAILNQLKNNIVRGVTGYAQGVQQRYNTTPSFQPRPTNNNLTNFVRPIANEVRSIATQQIPSFQRTIPLTQPFTNPLGFRNAAMEQLKNFRLNSPQQAIQNVGTDIFNSGKLGANLLGGSRLLSKGALPILGANAGIGGLLNKLGGGSFAEGAGQGVAITPQIMGITRLTNPLIEQNISRVLPRINPNLVNNPVGKYLATSTIRGAQNVPEGALIDAALNRRPLGAGSVALDFASGFIPGGGKAGRMSNVNANAKQLPMHPEDADFVKKTLARAVEMRGTADYDIRFRKKDEAQLRELAGFYMNKEFAKKAPFQDIAQELFNRAKVDTNEMQFGLPRMGIVDDNAKNVAQGGGEIPKELDPLSQVAKEYKSADEFIVAMRGREVLEKLKYRALQAGPKKDLHFADLGKIGKLSTLSEKKQYEIARSQIEPLRQRAKELGGVDNALREFWNKANKQPSLVPPTVYSTQADLVSGNNAPSKITKQLGKKPTSDSSNPIIPQSSSPLPQGAGNVAQQPLSDIGKVGNKVVVDAIGGLRLPVEIVENNSGKMRVKLLTDSSLGKAGEVKNIGQNYILSTNSADVNNYINAIKKDLSAPPLKENIRQNEIDNLIKASSPQQPVRLQAKPGTKIEAQRSAKIQQKLSPEQRTAQQVLEAQSPAPAMSSSGGNIGSSRGKDLSSSKYAYNINKNRLQLKPQEKQVLDQTVEAIKPELEAIRGKTLSNKEVIEAAKKSEVLSAVTTREETLRAEAATLRARQRLVELDKGIDQALKNGNTKQVEAQMKDMIESLRVVSSTAADAGRKLQSFSISAGDQSIRTQVLKEISKTGADTDQIIKEAAKVDWNNANSVSAFYRKFVKSTLGEILDEFRYNNMLSSPKTHIRNAYSNILQTYAARPMTLVFEGRPVEAAKYFGGAVKALPDAYNEFIKAFKGNTLVEKPDLDRIIPTGRLPRFMTIPTRALEAGDRFFTTLISGGEMARGQSKEAAEKMAEYSLFRQGLHPESQGTSRLNPLNFIDDITAWTYKAPKAVRWFVPFIRTPMNFAKQWIEYSPAGVTTLIGATNKREQLAKAMIGSSIATMGGMLALQGKTTWAAPTDPKQKELFYAAGRKPFSIQIGDRWVPMMYAGPFAMALAVPAAMKYYQEDSRTALTDSQVEKAIKMTSSMAEFLSGQTFMDGIGNFVKFFSGDADYSLGSNLGFTAGQLIPMQGLIRYVNTLVDPVYRKAGGFVGSIQSGIPGLSQELEPYTDPMGNISTRDPFNRALPYDTGKINEDYEQGLQFRTGQLQQNAVKNKLKKDLEKGGTGKIENTIYWTDPETFESGTIDLNKVLELPESNRYEKQIKESKMYATSNEIMKAPLSDEEKKQYLDQIGMDYNDARYYQIASQNNNEKSLYVTQELDQIVKSNGTQKDFLTYLVNARKAVNGDRIASDGVIDNLVEDGYIDYATGRALKQIKPENAGKVKAASGRKKAAIKPPAFKTPASTSITLVRPKKMKGFKLGKSPKLATKVKAKVKGVEDFQKQLQAIEQRVKQLA